jgi:hypothetical protein
MLKSAFFKIYQCLTAAGTAPPVPFARILLKAMFFGGGILPSCKVKGCSTSITQGYNGFGKLSSLNFVSVNSLIFGSWRKPKEGDAFAGFNALKVIMVGADNNRFFNNSGGNGKTIRKRRLVEALHSAGFLNVQKGNCVNNSKRRGVKFVENLISQTGTYIQAVVIYFRQIYSMYKQSYFSCICLFKKFLDNFPAFLAVKVRNNSASIKNIVHKIEYSRAAFSRSLLLCLRSRYAASVSPESLHIPYKERQESAKTAAGTAPPVPFARILLKAVFFGGGILPSCKVKGCSTSIRQRYNGFGKLSSLNH